MIIYLVFLILALLPLVEGELLSLGRFLILGSCLPLSLYILKSKIPLLKLKKKRSKGSKAKSLKCKIFLIEPGLILIWFLFLAAAGLSTVFSAVWPRSLNKLLLYLAYFIWFLAGRLLAKKDKLLFKQLLKAGLLLPSLILSLLSFWLFFVKKPPPLGSMNLIWANFGHNHLVDFLILAFPLSLSLFFKAQGKKERLGLALLNLVFLAGFAVSFSRGGVLIGLLELLLIGFWADKNKDIKKDSLSRLFLISAVAVLALFLTVGFWGYLFIDRQNTAGFPSGSLVKFFRPPPFSNRLEYWRQALKALSRRPFFGWGLDNFRYASKKFCRWSGSWSWYAHNHFLQILAETGFFGGLVFLSLTALLLKKIFKPNRPRFCFWQAKNFGLRIALAASTFHSFFDFDWEFSSVSLIFWTTAAFLTASQKKPAASFKQARLDKIFKRILVFLSLLVFLAGFLGLASRLLIFQGAAKEEEKNYSQAAGCYRLSLKIWPIDLENWQALLSFYRQNHKQDEAVLLLQRLIELEPVETSHYQVLADFAYQDQEMAKALKLYQQAADLSPADSLDLYLKVIEILANEEDFDKQDFYRLLTKIEELKGQKCILKCLGFENEKKLEDILVQLVEEKDLDEFNQVQRARIYYWLAVLTTYKQDWPKNIDQLEEACRLDNRPEYQEFLTDLYLTARIRKVFYQGDYQQTASLAQGFEDHFKNKKPVFHQRFYLGAVQNYLGRIYLNKAELNQAGRPSQLEKAKTHFKKGLAVNPWGDELYANLAQIFLLEQNKTEAEESLKRCLKFNSGSSICREKLENLED